MDKLSDIALTPLVIEQDYLSFDEFLKNEKYRIYLRIVNAFEEMIGSNNGDKTLFVIEK